MNNNYSNKDKNSDNKFFIDLYSPIDQEIIRSIERDDLQDALQYLKDHGIYIKDIIDDIDNEALIKNESDRILSTVDIMLEDFKKIDVIESELKKMLENSINEIDPYKRENILKKIIVIRHYLSAYNKILKDRLLFR